MFANTRQVRAALREAFPQNRMADNTWTNKVADTSKRSICHLVSTDPSVRLQRKRELEAVLRAKGFANEVKATVSVRHIYGEVCYLRIVADYNG